MDNVGNIKFKEEFDYFKNNLNLISKWHSDSDFVFRLFTIYLFALIIAVILSLFIKLSVVIVSFILASFLFVCLLLAFRSVRKNKRAVIFEKMLYTGPLSDLFVDLEDTTIRYYKDKLIRHQEEMKGFKGSLIIKIYQDMITQKSAQYVKVLEKEKTVVSELKMIKDI